MTRIKVILAVLCVGLTLLWLDADRIWLSGYSFNQTRLSLLNYSGIIAMGMLAVSLVLALRSTATEPGPVDFGKALQKGFRAAGLPRKGLPSGVVSLSIALFANPRLRFKGG